MVLSYWVLLVVGILLSAFGGIFLKMGAVQIHYQAGLWDIIFQLIKCWPIILGLACYFLPALIWIYLLNKVDISFLQPLFSIIYVITPILAIIFFQESVPMLRWVGILVIITGVSLVAQG